MIILALVPAVAQAQQFFTEYFTTSAYKDDLNTTADWNTDDGELKLFPFQPTVVGSYTTEGAVSVLVDGDLAFLADVTAGNTGLVITNISDPTTPAFLGNLALNDPRDVAVGAYFGRWAYVADGSSGLRIVNYTDPTNPSLWGSYATPNANAVTAAGDYAYVADGNLGLMVFDVVTNPDPTLMGTLSIAAVDVVLAGDLAFVASEDDDLCIVDVSNPGMGWSPTLIHSYEAAGVPTGLDVAGNYAFVTKSDQLLILDISDPASITFAGSYNALSDARGVEVVGNRAYVADGASGLRVIDIEDPTAPVLISSCDTPGAAQGVSVSGRFAYVADGAYGLRAIEVATPVVPASIGYWYEPWSTSFDVAISGDYAFVAAGDSGLVVIDIEDPTNPMHVGTYDTPGQALGVTVSGDQAFVADGLSGLQVIDIEDPTNPMLLGSYDTPGLAQNVVVVGEVTRPGGFDGIDERIALVADGGPYGHWTDSGLQVINISNPAAPVMVGERDTFDPCRGVEVYDGRVVYLAEGGHLRVANLIGPIVPYIVTTITTSDSYNSAVAGDYLYVADGAAGLRVFNIEDPWTPVQVHLMNTPGTAYDVAVSGDRAYVADSAAGLQVVDISDPTTPEIVYTFDTPGVAQRVAVDGLLAFVADYGADLRVIEVLQDEIDVDNNIGQSLAVDGGTDTIVRARLTSTQTAGVSWQVSANNGGNWQAIVSDGGWNRMTAGGGGLLWRSMHSLPGGGSIPGFRK